MAPMNRMTNLLNKIERRLGIKMLNLPPELSKDEWAKTIDEDSLTTFSRFFPNEMTIVLGPDLKKKDGWYIIDEYVPDNIEILGVRDVDFPMLSQDASTQHDAYGFGIYSVLPTDYSYDDIAAIQMRADLTSIFLNQIFVKYKAPNMIRLESNYHTDVTRGFKNYPLHILIKHAPNLMTIPPTMMETFEDLATCDVAGFLYGNLKYMDGLETVYANIDLKLDQLETEKNKREDIVQKLDEAHVSAANPNQPLILCV